jgi:hypothetical protein
MQIEELEYLTENIKDYRDMVIAHLDKREFTKWFHIYDLDRAIYWIKHLAENYFTLIQGGRPKDFIQKIKPEWKEIFKLPWT